MRREGERQNRKLILKESKVILYLIRGHVFTIFKVTGVGLGLGWLPGNTLSSTESFFFGNLNPFETALEALVTGMGSDERECYKTVLGSFSCKSVAAAKSLAWPFL